jgi:hypothetical protein
MRAADRIGTLFSPCRHLPQGDNGVWVDHRFTWKLPESWIPRLTAWLTPRSCADAMRRLDPGIFRDLCWDGPDWGDVLGRCLTGNLECHADALAEALERSVLRTFHGCRTDDAGSYFREGLRVHDREAMTARLRSIVERHEKLRWMKETLDAAIKQVGNELDHGRLYVVADDTVLLRYAAHQLADIP